MPLTSELDALCAAYANPCDFVAGLGLTRRHHRTKKSTPYGVLRSVVSQSQAKSNSACPTLTNLKSGEFDPPEIKLLDKLEFDYSSVFLLSISKVITNAHHDWEQNASYGIYNPR